VSASKKSNEGRARKPWLIVAGLLLALLSCWAWMSWTRVPQFQATPEAIKTVDALFTAITSRDAERMAACKAQLTLHTSNGKMSPQAMKELEACCEQASSGEWETAAKRLYRLIDKQ
jgi:predicted negative regulator of RcsB-dependent stress response